MDKTQENTNLLNNKIREENSGLKDRLFAKRKEYSSKISNREYWGQLANEIGSGKGLWGIEDLITRIFVGQKTLADMSEYYYNAGFEDATGVDLYGHEAGNAGEQLKKRQQKAENKLFWTGLAVTIVVCALIGAAFGGFWLGEELFGSGAGAIAAGAGIGLAGGVLVGGVLGAIIGWIEKQQTLHHLGSRSHEAGRNAGERAFDNLAHEQKLEKEREGRKAEVDQQIKEKLEPVEQVMQISAMQNQMAGQKVASLEKKVDGLLADGPSSTSDRVAKKRKDGEGIADMIRKKRKEEDLDPGFDLY